MGKWWKAAILASLGWASTAAAQMPHGPMMQSGPAPMAAFAGEPTAMPSPQFCPTPMPRKEPENPFCLTNDGSPNAWSDDRPAGCEMTGVIFNIGGFGLARQSLGQGVIAIRDPQNIDTGIAPPAGQPVISRFNNVPMDMTFGVRGSLGYREAGYAVELSGFYLPWSSRTQTIADPGRIDLMFAGFDSPIGFQGNNFLWTQADRVTLRYEQEIASAEANFRCGNGYCFEWIAGIRAMQVRERFGILTEDDSLTVQPINPTQAALYQVGTRNQMLLGQIGMEMEQLLLSRVAIGGYWKAGVGINFAEVGQSLQRGDGLIAFSQRHSRNTIGQAYETGLFTDVLITDQWRIRLGYQALLLVNTAQAAQNVDFNVANPGLNIDYSGSVFYHGPMAEFQFVF